MIVVSTYIIPENRPHRQLIAPCWPCTIRGKRVAALLLFFITFDKANSIAICILCQSSPSSKVKLEQTNKLYFIMSATSWMALALHNAIHILSTSTYTRIYRHNETYCIYIPTGSYFGADAICLYAYIHSHSEVAEISNQMSWMLQLGFEPICHWNIDD